MFLLTKKILQFLWCLTLWIIQENIRRVLLVVWRLEKFTVLRNYQNVIDFVCLFVCLFMKNLMDEKYGNFEYLG